MSVYIKYPLNYQLIKQILIKMKKKKINFFIDVNSICKGFYNSNVIITEIGECLTKGTYPTTLLDEMKTYLLDLYTIFKDYDPFFTLFYDDGYNIQNKIIMNSYKSGRSVENVMTDSREREVFFNLKKYYFEMLKKNFTKNEDISTVFYFKNYETDFIPHYCIRNGYFDSDSKEILNVILSVDKDLLQTCQFNNTVQCITYFQANKKTGRHEIRFGIFDNKNALSYVYKKFKPGIVTAKYVPLVLALAGDVSDSIGGLKSIGPAKAIKFIEQENPPATLTEIKNSLDTMPKLIKDNFDIISRNLKLIDFDEQIKRIPSIEVLFQC